MKHYLPESEADMNNLNLISIASRLQFAPREGGAISDNIYDKKAALVLAVPQLNCATAEVLKNLAGDGVLVIEKKDNKKAIYSNARYAIVRADGVGVQGETFVFKTLDQVKEVLRKGWCICRSIGDHNYITVLRPEDESDLTSYHNKDDVWRDLVAAVVNIDIERSSDWTTDGAYGEMLTRIVGASNLATPDGESSAAEYAFDFITGKLEDIFNQVFTFVREDPTAFYYATSVSQGVCVTRYTDARAFVWHYQTANRLIEEESAKEEGYGS